MIIELGDVMCETKAVTNVPPLTDSQFIRPF
jgi:hypothetical protein